MAIPVTRQQSRIGRPLQDNRFNAFAVCLFKSRLVRGPRLVRNNFCRFHGFKKISACKNMFAPFLYGSNKREAEPAIPADASVNHMTFILLFFAVFYRLLTAMAVRPND